MIEYVCDEDAHTAAVPVIVPGWVGAALIVTASVLAMLDPQPFAITEIVPPVLPAVVAIEVLVEVPDQPLGKVQV